MIYIILAVLLYTTTILVGATATRHLGTVLSSAINVTISAVIPLIAAIPLLSRKDVPNDKFGYFMAVLGGISVALFVLALNKSFEVNKIGIVSPIVFGGAIFLSTLLSYFIFKEKVSPVQGVGLAFLAVGLLLIIYAQATSK